MTTTLVRAPDDRLGRSKTRDASDLYAPWRWSTRPSAASRTATPSLRRSRRCSSTRPFDADRAGREIAARPVSRATTAARGQVTEYRSTDLFDRSCGAARSTAAVYRGQHGARPGGFRCRTRSSNYACGFEPPRAILIGNRGNLTHTQFNALRGHHRRGLDPSALRLSGHPRDWPSTARSNPRSSIRSGSAEISSVAYPGERRSQRSCYRHGLGRSGFRARTPDELLVATEARLARIAAAVARRTKTPMTADEIGVSAPASTMSVGKIIDSSINVGIRDVTIEDASNPPPAQRRLPSDARVSRSTASTFWTGSTTNVRTRCSPPTSSAPTRLTGASSWTSAA